MVHTVDIFGINFSHSLMEYVGMVTVSSCEHIQGDGVSSIIIVGITFAVRERKVRADVNVGEWSGCHPMMCDTNVNIGHRGV